MALLEMSELPGRASMIDWALALGSVVVGTLDAGRATVKDVIAGTDRGTIDGRRRAAPTILNIPAIRMEIPLSQLAS